MYRTKLLLIALFALCNVFTLTIKAQSDGKASYYSNGLHGRRMSNGERYDRNAFTCAHRTLPFGTRLKITNPRNGKSVIVRVTDRGPFVRGRVVDLSYAAARELGTLASGVAYVKVELVRKETEIPFPSESMVHLKYLKLNMVLLAYAMSLSLNGKRLKRINLKRLSAKLTRA